MQLVLLSGGSGTRLWPLSNASRSKQFLKVLQGPGGRLESMAERVWRQLGEAGLQGSAHIAAGSEQEDILRSQLGGVPLILEPDRRDTFPAVALSAAYLHTERGVSEDETVVILPVDPYVEPHFFETVGRLDEALSRSGADLALIGVRPEYPTDKYGYIVPSEFDPAPGSAGMRVGRFREKPPVAQAERLIREGALWNCGVFAFRLGFLLELLRERGLPCSYAELSAQYGSLAKTSFDYEVVERVRHIVAVAYEGAWKDLGTWATLSEEMDHHVIGNGYMTDDCMNSHIINELDIPVALIGIDDCVVAAGADGIIVANKSVSHRIKDISGRFGLLPRLEVSAWGHSKIVDQYAEDGQQAVTKRLTLLAGANLSYHYHEQTNEVWTVIAGEGEAVIDGRLLPARPGDVFVLPSGTKHSMRAFTEMELLEVQRSPDRLEKDFRRVHVGWEAIREEVIATAG